MRSTWMAFSYGLSSLCVEPFPRTKFATIARREQRATFAEPPVAHLGPSKFDALSHSHSLGTQLTPSSAFETGAFLQFYAALKHRPPVRAESPMRSQSANFWTHTHQLSLAHTQTQVNSRRAERVCTAWMREMARALSIDISLWLRVCVYGWALIPMRERIDTYQTHTWGELMPYVCVVCRHIINTRAPTLYLHTDCQPQYGVWW